MTIDVALLSNFALMPPMRALQQMPRAAQ